MRARYSGEREKYRELQKVLRERKERDQTDVMIRDGKIVKRRDGTKGQNDMRGVHEKANQTRKEETAAQAQTTTREKGAVATAGKKAGDKKLQSRAVNPKRGKL